MFDSNALCLILTLLSRLAHVVYSCAPNRFDLFKSGVARRNVSSEYFYGLKSGSWAISALATLSGEAIGSRAVADVRVRHEGTSATHKGTPNGALFCFRRVELCFIPPAPPTSS